VTCRSIAIRLKSRRQAGEYRVSQACMKHSISWSRDFASLSCKCVLVLLVDAAAMEQLTPVHALPDPMNFASTWIDMYSTDPSSLHILISKLVPHPQLLVAAGLPTILNWLPINSMV
jgi:hypothetical protein